MPTRKRTNLALEAVRANRQQLDALGGAARAGRLRRRLTQTQLGARAGLSQSAISHAERGLGSGLTVDAWQRIAVALGIRLRIELQRDPQQEPQDSGHLRIQELVLRLGRRAGYRGCSSSRRDLSNRGGASTSGWPTTPIDAWVVECWNVFGDIGAAARTSNRKLAEADALATLRWAEQPHSTGLVWVVRATNRNRALVARYPEVFAARFPGSSRGWVEALSTGGAPPPEPGLVWASADGSRLFAWRRQPAERPAPR